MLIEDKIDGYEAVDPAAAKKAPPPKVQFFGRGAAKPESQSPTADAEPEAAEEAEAPTAPEPEAPPKPPPFGGRPRKRHRRGL